MNDRIRFDVHADLEKNIHKVFFKNKRTIVAAIPLKSGQFDLPVGKSGEKCYSRGFVERMNDEVNWDKTEWLSTEEAQEEGIPILEDKNEGNGKMKETAGYSPIVKPKTWKRRVPKFDKNQVKLFMPFIRKIQQEEMKELDKEITEERKNDEEFYNKEKMQAEIHQIKVQLVEQNIDNLKKRKRELFLKLKEIQEEQAKKKLEEELKNDILQQKLEEEKRGSYYEHRRQNAPPIMGSSSSYRQGSSSPITPIMNRSPYTNMYPSEQSQQHSNYYSSTYPSPQQMYSPTGTGPSNQLQLDQQNGNYKRNNYNGNNYNNGNYGNRGNNFYGNNYQRK